MNLPLQSRPPSSNDSQEPIFDDALPRALKSTPSKVNASVTLHREHVAEVTSPYIIHLGNEVNSITHPQESLSELEAQIRAQQALFLEDEELTNEDSESEIDLSINFQDLAEQLRETDRNTTPIELVTLMGAGPETQVEQTNAPEEPSAQFHNFTINATEVIPLKPKARIFWHRAKVKAVASFTALSLAFIMPLHALTGLTDVSSAKQAVVTGGESALDYMRRGSESLSSQQYELAESNFARASQQFSQAREELSQMNAIVTAVASLIPETERARSSAKHILIAGEELAYVAESFTQATTDITTTSPNLSLKLSILSKHMEQALPHLENASTSLEKIHVDAFPADQQEQLIKLQSSAPSLLLAMKEFLTLEETLQTILGETQTMRYLVAFQNTAELRATGGFMGSFAELDIERGEIVNMHVPEGGTYAVQGQLTRHIASPEPLQLINARWELQDANWSPDFSQSAQKMAWFYENAGGPSVDGVIAVNSTLLPSLLEITGPIVMEERAITVSSENILFEIDRAKALTPDAPKSLISDLTPLLFERLANLEMQELLLAVDLLGKALTQKDIQLFFASNALQSRMMELGWAGTQSHTTGDYLMVVNSNIGGGKTDTIIDQTVDMSVSIQSDGTVINTVTLTKEHHGIASASLDGLNNVDYVRFYVPKGSKLLKAEGFLPPPASLFEQSTIPLQQDEDLLLSVTNKSQDPITQTDSWDESGKTVFGNWMQTQPGKTNTVTIQYTLPFRVIEPQVTEPTLLESAKARFGLKNLANYSLLVEPQSGADRRIVNASVSLPNEYNLVWSSEGEATSISVEPKTTGSITLLVEQSYD